MKRFFKEQNGNALIWSLFIVLILCTISFMVYSGITVYSKYQTAETELQRAVIVTVDMSMENANVRDMQLDIPSLAETLLEENLTNTGWIKEDGDWIKRDGSKLKYRLEGMKIEVVNQLMQIDATVAIPLPWAIGNTSCVRIPMRIRASILYVD